MHSSLFTLKPTHAVVHGAKLRRRRSRPPRGAHGPARAPDARRVFGAHRQRETAPRTLSYASRTAGWNTDVNQPRRRVGAMPHPHPSRAPAGMRAPACPHNLHVTVARLSAPVRPRFARAAGAPAAAARPSVNRSSARYPRARARPRWSDAITRVHERPARRAQHRIEHTFVLSRARLSAERRVTRPARGHRAGAGGRRSGRRWCGRVSRSRRRSGAR